MSVNIFSIWRTDMSVNVFSIWRKDMLVNVFSIWRKDMSVNVFSIWRKNMSVNVLWYCNYLRLSVNIRLFAGSVTNTPVLKSWFTIKCTFLMFIMVNKMLKTTAGNIRSSYLIWRGRLPQCCEREGGRNQCRGRIHHFASSEVHFRGSSFHQR